MATWHPDSLADRLPFLRRRTALTRATRGFFEARGYTEVETPYAVRTPGEEVHLRPFATEREGADGGREALWLHTSPEFAMKRLLVAQAGPIFQLARVWRNGEAQGADAPLHSAEFTMLEWYRPGASLAGLMDEVEAFLRAVLPPVVEMRGVRTSLDAFERVSVADAFARHVGADVLGTAGDAGALAAQAGVVLREGEEWEDLFFRLMLERVEPHLGRDRPTFLTHWPSAQAALARRDPGDPRQALRFELFVCGVELGNAFEELCDPGEQRARFEADRGRRRALGGGEWPLDEELLAAMGHGMPACSGIAVGFDRLAMIAGGARRIGDVMWLG
ncbi:MAG: EF-P lysine aminoacylase EpmA [Janthinobacterium lividum]